MQIPSNRTEAIRYALRQLWDSEGKHPCSKEGNGKSSAADVHRVIEESSWVTSLRDVFPKSEDGSFDKKTWNALVSGQRRNVLDSINQESGLGDGQSSMEIRGNVMTNSFEVIQCLRSHFRNLDKAKAFLNDDRLISTLSIDALRAIVSRYDLVLQVVDGDADTADQLTQIYDAPPKRE